MVFLSVLKTDQRNNYVINHIPRHVKRHLTEVVWPRPFILSLQPLQGIASLIKLGTKYYSRSFRWRFFAVELTNYTRTQHPQQVGNLLYQIFSEAKFVPQLGSLK